MVLRLSITPVPECAQSPSAKHQSAACCSLCLSRNDAVGKGERDRPGRSVRRLAEQIVSQIPFTIWCVGYLGRALPARRRDADGSGRDDRAPHPSTASLRPRKTKSSRFRIDRLDQSLDVTVTKRKSLEAVGIIRMTRHVVGTNRSGELSVPQHPHDVADAPSDPI